MKTSIFARTATILLALAIFPTLVVGYIQMRIVQSALNKDFQEVRAKLAERTAKNVTDFLANVTNMLTTISQLDEVTNLNPKSMRAVVEHVLQSEPVIAEISVYGREGEWIFGMKRTLEFLDTTKHLEGLSDYVRDMVRQEGMFQGNILRVANYPAIEIFVPVRTTTVRAVVGYMRAVISLAALSRNLEETKIGKTSEFFVCDTKNRLIAHSSNKNIFKQESSNLQIDPAIAEEVRRLGPYNIWNGTLRLKDGRNVVVALKKLENSPWVVGVMQESWEAFVVMVAMRQKVAEVLLLAIIGVFFIALFFASRISFPIRSLTQASRQLMLGNFSKSIESLPKSSDEIGELSQAFETMSRVLSQRTTQLIDTQKQLEGFNQELEERVEARTKELRATQDELIKQERLAAIGQMASVVGHELRNPLSVINNSLYVIKTRLSQESASSVASSPAETTAIDPKVLKHVGIIEAELQVANQIISEILTFSRTREVMLREVELHALLEEIVSKLELPAGMELTKNYVAHPVRMKLDPDEIRQAVRNLVGNAIDAMPNGGKIILETHLNKNSVLLSIADTGGGISPEILPKIFTPFFTSKPKGTGLGLAVVKKIMDRHNAEIHVESEVGKGTKFILKLPLI